MQLAVPFTVRLGDWALGPAGPPTVSELGLLGCALASIALVTVRRGGRRTAS
ncbi:hypothetical protein [Streptomyces sp. KL116D]|uniref:hypothetical protein n=1 Tax=Streptomyces sp. KL116D TaxID=3045152 RepID=UPI003555FFC9